MVLEMFSSTRSMHETRYLVLHSPQYDLPTANMQAHYQMLGKVRRQATAALSMGVVISLFHSTVPFHRIKIPMLQSQK